MALLFIEGFDAYTAPSKVSYKWIGTTTMPTSKLVNGRDDLGQAFQFVATSNNAGSIVSPTFGPSANNIVGFAFRNDGMPPAPFVLLNFFNGSVSQVQLVFDPTNGLFSYYTNTNGTPIATGTTVITQGVWYFIEAAVQPGSGSVYVALYINTNYDVSVFNGATTSVVANTTSISFSCPLSFSGGAYAIDDVSIIDSTGSYNNTYMGDCKVETIYTSGVGTNTNWTIGGTPLAVDNYLAVQKFDKAYVQTATVSLVDTYAFDDLQLISTVNGVAINVFAKTTDAAINVLNGAIESGGTEYNTAQSYSVGNVDWLCFQFIQETDPDTSALWLASGVNSAEFGQVLTS